MSLFVILLISSIVISHAFNRDDHEVKYMPNLHSNVCWRHYSGYIPVAGGKKSLFYWYHEATESPETKPFVLWLNGGPGCSSLGGMFTELGPFVVDKNLDVTLNPYSWNTVANVLFLEQPAGVGFSYPIEKFTNDSITSADTYEALTSFIQDYSELQNRSFYITGESYGGHYVPNTAKAILDGNAKLPAGSSKYINLIGFAVGNGYTDWQLDFNANVPNTRYHALTSQVFHEAAMSACDGNTARCFWPRPDVECPSACNKAVTKAVENAMDGSIDIYDIYEDVCLPGQDRLDTQMSILLKERHKQVHRVRVQNLQGRRLDTRISPIFPTCINNYQTKYLNLPEVQRAIHVAPDTVPKGKWSDCGNVNYNFNYESGIPNYMQWVKEGKLQMLIYNGDADYILSHMGNSAWINKGLKLEVAEPWKKWRGSDRQVAGYYKTYKTGGPQLFTFLTVKGAGHMVPKDRPVHGLNMFSRFLAGGGYDKVPPADIGPLCPKRG